MKNEINCKTYLDFSVKIRKNVYLRVNEINRGVNTCIEQGSTSLGDKKKKQHWLQLNQNSALTQGIKSHKKCSPPVDN